MPGLRNLTSLPIRKKLLLLLLFIFLPANGAVIVSGFSNQWILGIAALSAMLLAWLWGNFTFAARIKPLVTDVLLLGRGELGTRTGLPHTPDELGQLAKSFDEMASLVETGNLERKRAEQALRESEVRYRTLFESATDAIFLVLDNKFIDCNDAALKMYGYTREELIGNYPYAVSPAVQPTGRDSKEEAIEKMAGAFSGTPQFFEWRHCRGDGTLFDAEVSLNRVELGNEVLILGIIRDITSRKQAQEALQQSNARICHLNDVLRAIRDAGSLINREKDPIELLKAVCDSLVETRGYVMVWIGKPEADSKRVLPVANSGGDMDFLQHAPITWDDSPTGQGPAGTAMRERRAVVFNDLATDSRFALWKDLVTTVGGASIASFPLIHAESLFGVLTVKANRPCAFDLEEVDLLSNLAADLARALQNLENEVACKQAEEDLRASENRYRAIFENTGTATVIFEEDTLISLANAEFEKLTGYTKDEIENKKSWTEFVVKEDLESLLDRHRLRASDAKAALNRYEFRLIDRHDRIKNCLLTIDVIANTQRRVASLRDITERRQAENALISANRQLNEIIEFLPDATFVVDRDKKVIAWNRAMEEMAGVSKEEMIGKGDHAYTVPFYGDRRPHLLDLLDAPDEELESKYQHVTKKGGILRAETYVPCVYGGQGAYVFCTGAPLFDAHGNLAGAIESIRDITEQRQAQDALRRSEEKYRELVENANSIILRMDYVGNVTFFNEFAQSFFGYSEEEIVGKNVVGTIVPEVESTTGRDLRLMIEDIALNPDRYASNINENMRSGGEMVWIAWTNKPILDENGRVVEVLCVGNDITERKWALEALEESEARLKIAMDIAKLVQWEYDVKSGMFTFDEQFYALYGTTSQQEGGPLMTAEAYARRFIPLEESHVVPDGIAKALATTDPNFTHQVEHRIIRADGEERHIVVRHGVVCDQTGKVVKTRGVNQDITERKQAEDALIDSEQRFRTLFDSANDAIFIQKDYLFIDCNNKALEMFGCCKEDIVGHSPAEISPETQPDGLLSSEKAIKKIDMALAGTPQFFEWESLRMDGVSVNTEVSLNSLEIGGEIHLQAIVRDITKRKQADEELIESRQQLSDIIDFLPDATLVIDKEGKVIAWNRAIEKMTQIRAADMLGKGNYEYALPFYGERRPILIDLVLESRQEIEQKYAAMERTDRAIAGEAYMPALRGGEVYLRGTASALFDSRGNVAGAIESIRDVTERKQMQETLVEAEAKYRGIFENSVMGIFQVTPEGRFLSLNMACARILGYDSPEEVLNTISNISRQLYVNPNRRSEALRLLEERGMVQEFEAQMFRKDNSVAWISLSSHAVHDVNGKIVRIEGTAQDITESKRLTSQLNQAHKMEAIGTLAGGIAHDFNNILMPIIGYAEISLNAVPKDSRLHHNMEQILLSGNRARELVKQILTFSRKTEQEHRPVQVSLLVKETIKLLRSSLPSTIQILQGLDADTMDSTVLADPTQIHQVLMNLCTNAAHAMRGKAGELSITLKNVDIESVAISEVPDLTPGPYLRLSVADTGHGMNEAVKQRIFEPYFTTKGPSEGTGLGLALIYGIVQKLSGGIAVFSEPDQGATFDVYFPRTKMLQAPMVDALEPLPIGKGLVLVVDDEKPIVDMLKEMLECLGYDVAERYGSYDALEAFRSRADSFDLVITDLTMPHMTGIDLAREILKIRPDTPIILCTGFSAAVDENWTKRVGIKGFLMKPIDLRDLATTVNKILSQDKPTT